jgi:hypothetical protein
MINADDEVRQQMMKNKDHRRAVKLIDKARQMIKNNEPPKGIRNTLQRAYRYELRASKVIPITAALAAMLAHDLGKTNEMNELIEQAKEFVPNLEGLLQGLKTKVIGGSGN